MKINFGNYEYLNENEMAIVQGLMKKIITNQVKEGIVRLNNEDLVELLGNEIADDWQILSKYGQNIHRITVQNGKDEEKIFKGIILAVNDNDEKLIIEAECSDYIKNIMLIAQSI